MPEVFPWKYTSAKCQICCSPSSTAQLLAVADRPLGSGFGLKVRLSLMQTPHLQVLVLEMRGLELPLHNLFSILIPTIWMDCTNIELGYGIISWDWKLLFAAMVSFGCEKYIHCESAQRSISEAEFKQYSMFISFKWEASLSSTHAHCDLKQSMFYPQIAFFCSPKYSTTAFNFLIHSWGLNPINVISDINRGIHSF